MIENQKWAHRNCGTARIIGKQIFQPYTKRFFYYSHVTDSKNPYANYKQKEHNEERETKIKCWRSEKLKRNGHEKSLYADEKRKPNYQKQIIQNAMHFMCVCVCGCGVVSVCSYICIYAVGYSCTWERIARVCLQFMNARLTPIYSRINLDSFACIYNKRSKILIVHNLAGIEIEIENVFKQNVMLYAWLLFTANEEKSPYTLLTIWLERTSVWSSVELWLHNLNFTL